MLVAVLESEMLVEVPLVLPITSVSESPIFCLLKAGSEASWELVGALEVGLKV